MNISVNESSVPDNSSFRDQFEAKLTEFEQENQGAQRKRWSAEKVLEVIKNIQNAMSENTRNKTAMEYYWTHKYDIMVVGNKEHLIFKRKSPNDPTVFIISRDKYFSILNTIHNSCGHGGRDKMVHALKSRFYIPKQAVQLFVSLCPTCQTKKGSHKKGKGAQSDQPQNLNTPRQQVESINFQSCSNGELKVTEDFNMQGRVDLMESHIHPEGKLNVTQDCNIHGQIKLMDYQLCPDGEFKVAQDFNMRGQVDLIDFQSCPDGDFKWLLNYQDTSTKFLSLRPLKTENTQEVAFELMKIFMIFGAPYILKSNYGHEFTENIIKELTSMWPECKIIVGSPRCQHTEAGVESSSQDVKNMLRSWMNVNKSTNWSIGCYHVQYKKNTSFDSVIGRSPYKALFSFDPKSGLRDSGIPSSILANVKKEEQLYELLEIDNGIDESNLAEIQPKIEIVTD